MMVIQVQLTREELGVRYAELVLRNPLLARIEGELRTLGWSDLEIRNAQLITAVRSNESYQAALSQYEEARRVHACCENELRKSNA